MKNILFAAGLCMLLGSITAQAALPEDYQRVKELRAIIDDERVGKELGRKPIDGIQRIEHDLYRITSGTCSMDVAIKTDQPFSIHGDGLAHGRSLSIRGVWSANKSMEILQAEGVSAAAERLIFRLGRNDP